MPFETAPGTDGRLVLATPPLEGDAGTGETPLTPALTVGICPAVAGDATPPEGCPGRVAFDAVVPATGTDPPDKGGDATDAPGVRGIPGVGA